MVKCISIEMVFICHQYFLVTVTLDGSTVSCMLLCSHLGRREGRGQSIFRLNILVTQDGRDSGEFYLIDGCITSVFLFHKKNNVKIRPRGLHVSYVLCHSIM